MQDGVLVLTAPAQHPDDDNNDVFAPQLLVANLAFRKQFPNVDQPIHTLIPDDDFWATVSDVMAHGQPKSYVLKTIAEEQKYYFHVELIPLTDPAHTANTDPLCVCVFNDYTAMRRTEKMRRDFVANVSHELRTPLSAIHGYAETLLEGALDDGPVAKEFTQTIFRHSTRLSQLVADLLDLSKLESPDFILDLDPVTLSDFIHGVVSMADKQITQKGLSISLDLADDLPKVLAHDRSLEQVFTNLLDNATKYTPAGGTITISATPSTDEAGMLEITIADSGLGIPPKHLSRLFERFYRVDKARSRDMGGTGLGLSIVKHIVQSHGGNIWVESTVADTPETHNPQAHGTTFTFTLPIALPESGSEA
jgi:two-component system phosphate regulon sensor histidine kinase PhoR